MSSNPAGFVHLEVHSHFTLLGGTASVADLAARAAADGMGSLALTDTNALYGIVSFARACREQKVRPILGMAVTVAAPAPHAPQPDVPGRLVLLATGPAGYRSLCRLSSLVQGSPERASLARRGLSWEVLQAHREGLLCLSGGRAGWIERCLRAGDGEGAQLYAARLAGIFGDDAWLSLELQTPAGRAVAQAVEGLGRRLGLRTVAVQPVYCLDPQDAPRLRLLAAVDHNCRLEDVPAAALPAAGDPQASLHWSSPAQIAERYAGFEEAVAATAEIAARCGDALPDGRPVWPALKLPHGQTPDTALAAAAAAGLEARYGPEMLPAARTRLADELAAITRRGYAPLFLVVADIVRFARENDLPVSTRGSVANSLVAYCTGITTVDPLTHGLLFERFLNPARGDVPDIDLDFCSRRRDQVLAYVRDTYGEDHVALVATVSTMQPRSAVWETGKAYGLDERQIRRLLAILPHGWHPDPRRRDRRTVEDILPQVEDPRLREVLRAAYSIVDHPHHLSVHPGGIIITPGPLTDFVPVQWAPKGFLITQFDHGDVERLGLPKIDLLGISALTVLADAAELVRRDHEPAFRLDAIPHDDPLTGELLSRGETVGVFQCESEGAQLTLRKLRARSVAGLAVANAFFKPGPAMGGMARTFVRRYRGEEPVAFLHPALAPILGPTQGVLLFQEQILRVAREIAGLSWEQADHLRRGASKFGAAEMAAIRETFIGGCLRFSAEGFPPFTQAQAETLWEQVMAFAGYGFNQGHATAYAEVSYRSAYLKAHYPAAYFCARLTVWGGFHHQAIYLAEARRLGIEVRPPHVNWSGRGFALADRRTLERWSSDGEIADSKWQISDSKWQLADGKLADTGDVSQGAATGYLPMARPSAVLWMGLGQVRDLREASIEAILAERDHGPFAGLRDLLRRVVLQPREVANLIRCGALDGVGVAGASDGEPTGRAALLAEAESIRRGGSALQMAFDFAAPEVPAETPAQRLAWEQEVLGLPVSVHPLDLADLPPHTPLSRLSQTAGRRVATVGVRLPGWTGGSGFFLGDRQTYVIVKTPGSLKPPPPWQPVLLHGRWAGDGWGSFCLQADEIQASLP